ncbi:MAG TPA: histidine kinase dimerization/phosphoacceptor domain -containing protein [Allosphingosinicella sp.]|nr:histidine kinase dimerization/phosphoacceptor domain -containing protein [Allosphingosinicella sp.]
MSDELPPELLAVCDREPIHIPGAIQPHGLLVLVGEDGRVAAQAGDGAAAAGAAVVSGEALEAMLGRPLAGVAAAVPPSGAVLLGTFTGRGGPVDVVAHRSGPFVLLEIEASDGAGIGAAAALGAAQALAARLESAHDLVEACREAAEAVRALTGYDRIMVYRFLADGSGAVVAEATGPAFPPLLNHHFPASDIPAQARALYARSLVRVIPDAGYTPAPLAWRGGAPPAGPVDMSDCHLRSVSPIHLQYLKNMGVAASASVSIMVAGELWGLVACHHGAPRPLGYVHRELAKHVGQLLGAQVAARQRSAAQLETVSLARRRDEMLQILAGAGSVEDSLLRHAGELMRTIPSDGAAILLGDRLACAGVRPGDETVRALLPALAGKAPGEPFATHRLADHVEGAEAFAGQASGALCCQVRSEPRLILCWLRAERVETVNWAGNPHKPAQDEAGALTPRRSFDLWRETVRGEARRWSAAEVDAADRVRVEVAGLLDRQELRVLNQQLRRTLTDKEDLLAQKDVLMREAHHRVQNSLQLVNSMLHLQEREVGSEEMRGHFERARQRLTAVAMVHRRLWRSDRLGDVRLDTFLGELVDELVKIWGEPWRPLVQLDVAPLILPTDKGIVVGLVITELLTNSVKYAYAGAPGPLAVDAAEDGRGGVRIAVCDRGAGLDPAAQRPGFGSQLVDVLVKQLGGTVDVRGNSPGARIVLEFPLEPAPRR